MKNIDNKEKKNNEIIAIIRYNFFLHNIGNNKTTLFISKSQFDNEVTIYQCWLQTYKCFRFSTKSLSYVVLLELGIKILAPSKYEYWKVELPRTYKEKVENAVPNNVSITLGNSTKLVYWNLILATAYAIQPTITFLANWTYVRVSDNFIQRGKKDNKSETREKPNQTMRNYS